MIDLLIGCPVAHRAWVLPHWFNAVEKACFVAEVTPQYLFVVDPDDESFEVIRDRAPAAAIAAVTNTRGVDKRDWFKESRLRYMVDLRNLLLWWVRQLQPRMFLSVDSDILLHPDHLASMVDALRFFDAVGGRCFMSEHGTRFPSWANLGREGQLMRRDQDGGLFKVDVIMALKLMSPEAYAVDYEFDRQGEDVGWSRACSRVGLTLGWDGRVGSKHVMYPHLLDQIDARVGF